MKARSHAKKTFTKFVTIQQHSCWKVLKLFLLSLSHSHSLLSLSHSHSLLSLSHALSLSISLFFILSLCLSLSLSISHSRLSLQQVHTRAHTTCRIYFICEFASAFVEERERESKKPLYVYIQQKIRAIFLQEQDPTHIGCYSMNVYSSNASTSVHIIKVSVCLSLRITWLFHLAYIHLSRSVLYVRKVCVREYLSKKEGKSAFLISKNPLFFFFVFTSSFFSGHYV